jgi:hypothetical protein
VDLLAVDGAAVSLVWGGVSRGTFGSSGERGRRLDDWQFTFGEGPGLDAVSTGAPVLVADLGDAREARWPAFGPAALGTGIRAVFALPVAVARSPVGALDLFRDRPGALSADGLHGGLWAAELVRLPLQELLTTDADRLAADDRAQLASLERVEVYQATGMLIGALDIDATEALVRLRAYAFLRGVTATEAAWAIVERRVSLRDEESFRPWSERPDGGSA